MYKKSSYYVKNGDKKREKKGSVHYTNDVYSETRFSVEKQRVKRLKKIYENPLKSERTSCYR